MQRKHTRQRHSRFEMVEKKYEKHSPSVEILLHCNVSFLFFSGADERIRNTGRKWRATLHRGGNMVSIPVLIPIINLCNCNATNDIMSINFLKERSALKHR